MTRTLVEIIVVNVIHLARSGTPAPPGPAPHAPPPSRAPLPR